MALMALPFGLGALRGLLSEIESSTRTEQTIAVGGAPELAAVLRRELARGAEAGAIRPGDSTEGAAVLLYVLGHAPTDADEQALRRARRARTPVVAVAAGPVPGEASIPYVLATDVVRVPPGEGFPLEEIAQAIASRLGEAGAPLAARIPLLRGAVCDVLTSSFSRKNGILAAATFVTGADLPLLTVNQFRLVLRIAQAHGAKGGRERLSDLAATFGAGIGLRALARGLLEAVPVAGWVLKGTVAYAGTRAIGEAAVLRFELGARPQQAATSPAAP